MAMSMAEAWRGYGDEGPSTYNAGDHRHLYAIIIATT